MTCSWLQVDFEISAHDPFHWEKNNIPKTLLPWLSCDYTEAYKTEKLPTWKLKGSWYWKKMLLVGQGIKERKEVWILALYCFSLFIFYLFSSSSPHSHLAGSFSSFSYFLFAWHTLVSLSSSIVLPLKNISGCSYEFPPMKAFRGTSKIRNLTKCKYS